MDHRADGSGGPGPQPPDGPVPRSGDGFLHCDDGQVRWGRFGAAGALFVVGTGHRTEALVQLRSSFAHQGGTWSCPGGAIDRGETPLVAALREATEEVGAPPEPWELLGSHVFAPAGDWRYETAVIRVPRRFGIAANFETTEVRWCTGEQIAALELHPGFAAALPHLLEIARR